MEKFYFNRPFEHKPEEDDSPDPVESEKGPTDVQKAKFERNKALGRSGNGVPVRKGKGKGRMQW